MSRISKTSIFISVKWNVDVKRNLTSVSRWSSSTEQVECPNILSGLNKAINPLSLHAGKARHNLPIIKHHLEILERKISGCLPKPNGPLFTIIQICWGRKRLIVIIMARIYLSSVMKTGITRSDMVGMYRESLWMFEFKRHTKCFLKVLSTY